MSQHKAREFWEDCIGSRFSSIDRAHDWITMNPSRGPITHYREVLPDDELERLRAEVNELREAEKQWEPQWKSEAAASAAGYNEAYDKFSDEIKTLKKENSKLREAAEWLREALEFISKGDIAPSSIKFSFIDEAYEDIARKALAKFDATVMKGGEE